MTDKPSPLAALLAAQKKPAAPKPAEAPSPAPAPAPAESKPAAPASLFALALKQKEEKPKPVLSESMSLDDIGSLDLSAFDSQSDTPVMALSETPAQTPVRDLPPDLSESQLEFVGLLDTVHTVLFDAEVFGQVTKNIMQELQDHPEYIKLIADADVNVMIRGMREAMGMAKIKKESKKPRNADSTTSKGKAARGKAVASDLLGLAAELGIGD